MFRSVVVFSVNPEDDHPFPYFGLVPYFVLNYKQILLIPALMLVGYVSCLLYCLK